MTRSATTALIVLVCVAARVRAQSPIEVFDDAYRDAEARNAGVSANPGEAQAAFRRAYLAFLKVPRGAAGYRERVTQGAWSAERGGEPAAALGLYDEAIASAPGEGFAVAGAIRSALASGDARAAVERAVAGRETKAAVVREALCGALGPDGQALLEEAGRRMRAGEVESGVFIFAELAAGRGEVSDLCNHALALRFLGEHEASIATYQRAVEIAPHDAIAWSDLGLALLAADRTADAREAFRTSVRSDARPGEGPGISNLALLARTGRGVDGFPTDAMREVVALRPEAVLPRWLWLDALLDERAPTVRHDRPAAGR